jgi:pimeloyl-ACP methyl ester carboxylesterase
MSKIFSAFFEGAVPVVGILLLSLLVAVLLRVPGFADLWGRQQLAPRCELLSQVPVNAGALIALDVRQSGTGDKFTPGSPSDWALEAAKQIRSSSTRSNDVVVYVHGFRTTFEDARCIGDNMRAELAQLPRYRIAGPDVVVFGWPGELGVFDFSGAQHNAELAGVYLGRLLAAVSDRRVYLVAHSLGAKVAMESASWVREIEGILLVQGAIRATSIRTWIEKIRTSFPVPAATLPRTSPDFPKTIKYDAQRKTGRYVNAAAKAKHFVVTVGTDAVLSRAYALDATLAKADADAPLVPPWVGEAPESLPQNLAIGSPFPSNPVYRHWDQPFPNHPLAGAKRSERLALAPGDTLQSTDWCYWFTVPHPSFHELKFTGEPWFYDEHSALADPVMRRYLLTEAWAFFFSPDARSPLAGLSQPLGSDPCSFMDY